MEKLTLEQALNEMSQAYAEHDNATKDRDDVINSALDAYFGEIEGVTSKKELKRIKAERKTEANNIKKVAKAMSAGKKDEVEEETDNMNLILSTIK